jgi:Zn-dependent peptidase ImmA (M78 family)
METEIQNKPRIGVARNLARKLLKDAGLGNPPISLQKLGDYLATKYNLQLEGIKDFSDKTSGATVTVNDTPTIAFNKNHRWYRRRFTIAHEIGHYIMKTGHNSIASAINSTDPVESEANEFAAELLMPLQQFKKDCKNGISSIDELMEKYQVSKEAAGWRLVHSGALGKL